MGCHTWFHKEYPVTLEQCKLDAIDICKYQISWNKEYIDDPNKEIDWCDDIEKCRENIKYASEFFTKCLRFIEKNIFKTKETLSRFYEFRPYNSNKYVDGLYEYCKKTDALYICTDDLPHDLFRIGGYPEDQLLSYNETLEYMKKYCEEYKVPFESHFGNIEDIKNELLQFWNEYPNGLITFG